jgi:hypothetical protein
MPMQSHTQQPQFCLHLYAQQQIYFISFIDAGWIFFGIHQAQTHKNMQIFI